MILYVIVGKQSDKELYMRPISAMGRDLMNYEEYNKTLLCLVSEDQIYISSLA